jgi:hypothetical protein
MGWFSLDILQGPSSPWDISVSPYIEYSNKKQKQLPAIHQMTIFSSPEVELLLLVPPQLPIDNPSLAAIPWMVGNLE